MNLNDDQILESAIANAKDQFLFAKTPQARREWLRTLELLVKRRSPKAVKRMERERRLG